MPANNAENRRMRQSIDRRKLTKMLEKAIPSDFFRLVWAANQLKKGHRDNATLYFTDLKQFPEDVPTLAQLNPWTLETACGEYLNTTLNLVGKLGKNRNLNCRLLRVILKINNTIIDIENSDDRFWIERNGILSEVHRLAQRQFPWQRGNFNLTNIYRTNFLYNFPESNDLFETKFEVNFYDYLVVMTSIYAMLSNYDSLNISNFNLQFLGISDVVKNRVFDLVSMEFDQLKKTHQAGRLPNQHTGYQKSFLRHYPCIRFGGTIISPLPDLIVRRSTYDVFYDIISDKSGNTSGTIGKLIGKRFEKYVEEMLKKAFPTTEIRTEFKYNRNQNSSPDIILLEDGLAKYVIECKATRASYDAKFHSFEEVEKTRGFRDLIKGVLQIWTFFSCLRRGLIGKTDLSEKNAIGILLTLDSWLDMSDVLQDSVLDKARMTAKLQNLPILEVDQRKILFCNIEDLENVLWTCDWGRFQECTEIAQQEDKKSWHLASIHETLKPVDPQPNKLISDSDILQHMPWWKNVGGKTASSLRT